MTDASLRCGTSVRQREGWSSAARSCSVQAAAVHARGGMLQALHLKLHLAGCHRRKRYVRLSACDQKYAASCAKPQCSI
jgi:hypothetical protein